MQTSTQLVITDKCDQKSRENPQLSQGTQQPWVLLDKRWV